MQINRENYMEYFLLYADNELNAEERRTVEMFVAAYPSLKEEFDELNASVFTPDELSYSPISDLLRTDDENVEDKMLLMLDDELEEKEKASLMEFISNDKTVAEEWEVLKSTKLVVEPFVLADKTFLYKKEPARIMPMWFRMAAAAAVVGSGLFFAFQLTSNNTINNSGDVNPPLASQLQNNSTQGNTNQQKVDSGYTNQLTEDVPVQYANNDESKVVEPNRVEQQKSPFVTLEHKVEPKENNVVPKKDQNNSNFLVNQSVIPVDERLDPERAIRTPERVVPSTPEILPERRRSPYAFTASNDQLSFDEHLELEPWMDDTENGKKGKKKNLFNKVKKVFDKGMPEDENEKVRIGAFQIAIK